jgi:soluble lytic murein transglycosylase-like protein
MTARADMKRVVTLIKSVTTGKVLWSLTTTAGVASYVTLVSLLIQREELQSAARARELAIQSAALQESMKQALRSQQAEFVSQIIRSHTRNVKDSQSLARIIVEESERASFDPLFVAAVIRSESMFQHRAISSRGAKGLMQLMPETGRYVSEKENIKLKDLNDPTTNIRIGIAYLKYLDKKFHGNREHVLIAYNWGPGNVLLSMKGSTRPPSQSVQYARTIISAHQTWSGQFSDYSETASSVADTAIVG